MSFILNCEPLSNSVWVTIEFFLFLHDYKYPTENTISTLSMRREPEYTWNVYRTIQYTLPLYSPCGILHNLYLVSKPIPNVSISISKSRPHIEMYYTGSEFTSCRHCDRWREMTRATSQFCVLSLYHSSAFSHYIPVSFNQSRVSFPIHMYLHIPFNYRRIIFW